MDILKRSSSIPKQLIEVTATRYERRIATLESNLQPAAFSPLFDEDQVQRHLMKKLLDGERQELMKLRQTAAIHDEVFFQLIRELDIEETRLRGQRI